MVGSARESMDVFRFSAGFCCQGNPFVSTLTSRLQRTSRIDQKYFASNQNFFPFSKNDRCYLFVSGTSGLASDPARLSLATIEKFTDKSNVVIRVPSGNTVPITCPVPYSSPEAVVQFYKNGSPVSSVNVTGSKTMVIENAKPSDSGEYDCTAENYITTQTYRSNYKTILEVYDGVTSVDPVFVKQPQTEYKVLRGQNVTLECFAAGHPVPRVTWTRLGNTLPSGSRYTPMGLSIVNVQREDRGEYDCMWSNGGARRIKSVIILRVVEVPRVARPPKTATFSEGGELELSCSVDGQPEPSLEWLINGEPLVRSENVEIKGLTLFISPVEKRHAGFVQCVASNDYGSHSGYSLLRVNPKQHVGGGGGGGKTRNHGPPNGGVHKHTRVGAGRRRSKEGHHKGTGNYRGILAFLYEVKIGLFFVVRVGSLSVFIFWYFCGYLLFLCGHHCVILQPLFCLESQNENNAMV